MTEPKPPRRPKSPRSADSSAVLAYLSELESYTSAIERAGRQLVSDVRQAESAWADHAGAHLQTIARLEAELAFKRGVLDQVQGELTAARAALDQIDRHRVGAYETDGGSVEPCDECGEMRDIAAQALQTMKANKA